MAVGVALLIAAVLCCVAAQNTIVTCTQQGIVYRIQGTQTYCDCAGLCQSCVRPWLAVA